MDDAARADAGPGSLSGMEVAAALAALGGTAGAAQLVPVVGRRALAAAERCGDVVRLSRGVYGLPGAPPALHAAAALRGVVSHESAAQLHFLDTVRAPVAPHVTLPRDARRRALPVGVRPHWSVLAPADVSGAVTTPLRTVLDCARTMPFREALAVADSSLRREAVLRPALLARADQLTGPGRVRVLRVVRAADRRAANPFESALRGSLLDAGLASFEPQARLRVRGVVARVDLADLRRRIVLEADSFSWHGSRSALARDCRRYDELVVAGWMVLRFAWEQVMFEEAWVVRTVRAAVGARDPKRVPAGLRKSA